MEGECNYQTPRRQKLLCSALFLTPCISSSPHASLPSAVPWQAFIAFILGWCKSNCGFALLNFTIWYWNTFWNKCGYAIHHFNVNFSLYFFLLIALLAVYFLSILDYRNDVQKANLSNFLMSSKRVIKHQRQLAASTTHLAQLLCWFKEVLQRRWKPWRWGL